MDEVDAAGSPEGGGAVTRDGPRAGTLAGQGDPEVSIRLLWRSVASPASPASPAPRARPGRRPGLDVDAIVEAAIAVADAAGVAGTSMRAVANRLGVTAMALYTYVPGKAELVDLMYDGVHAELPRDYDLRAGWRPALVRWADDLLALYLRHPWASRVSFAHAVLGPHEQAVLETLAVILRRTGLPAGTLRRVTTTLFHLIRGTARTVTESRDANAADGASEHDWWVRRTSALLAVVPDLPRRFPNSAWLTRGEDGHYEDSGAEDATYVEREATCAFRVGLDVLLDGLEAA